MQQHKKALFIKSMKKTLSMFAGILPIVAGVVLLSGLLVQFLPAEAATRLFGNSDILDAVIGATVGGISAGHPLTSYLLGGELLADGVSLVAVTALIISWVTVGSVQFPAEALMLGRRFALYRNLICYLFAILIALLTVATLHLLG